MTKRPKKQKLVSEGPEHDYCVITSYCKTCGQHRELLLYRGQPCLDPSQVGTVVAFSHRRALEVHEERWAHVIAELEDDDLMLDADSLEMIARDRHSEYMDPIEARMKQERIRAALNSEED